MRLSAILWFKKSVRGHIFRGKYRLVKRVSLQAMNTLRTEYEIQENNMLLLRHPYLTAEESSGHAKALGKTAAKLAMWNNSRNSLKPSVTLEERLAHLNVSKSWEP